MCLHPTFSSESVFVRLLLVKGLGGDLYIHTFSYVLKCSGLEYTNSASAASKNNFVKYNKMSNI